MHRRTAVALLAAAACLGFASTAQASPGDPGVGADEGVLAVGHECKTGRRPALTDTAARSRVLPRAARDDIGENSSWRLTDIKLMS